MPEIPISAKLYEILANHASEQNLSVDQFADFILKDVLDKPEIVKKALEEWRQKMMIKITFKKEGNTYHYILSRRDNTEYIGDFKWISNQKKTFKRIFKLSEKECESLFWKIVSKFYKNYSNRTHVQAPINSERKQ